jgi:hypothetical protein
MNKQIYLALSEQQSLQLREMLATNTDINTLQPLIQQLNTTNSDEFIRSQVIAALAHMSGKMASSIKDTHDLTIELGLTMYHKRALKLPFQRILANLNGTAVITLKECEKLKKVSDCIKLVKGKI